MWKREEKMRKLETGLDEDVFLEENIEKISKFEIMEAIKSVIKIGRNEFIVFNSINFKLKKQRMIVEIFEPPLAPSEKNQDRSIIRRSIIFIILIQLFGQVTANFYLKLLKPIPIFLLFFFLTNKDRQSKLVTYGLASSLIGDLSLMVRNDIIFQIGAGAFLIAHILYSMAFCMDINFGELTNLSKWRVSRLFLLCNVVTVVYILNTNALWEKTSNRFLFVLYGGLLTWMIICALMRQGTVKGKMYWCVSCGALLFGISDHLLAFLKFNHYHTDVGEAIIMGTYYLAQYLIVTGISRKNKKK